MIPGNQSPPTTRSFGRFCSAALDTFAMRELRKHAEAEATDRSFPVSLQWLVGLLFQLVGA
jgi:hypothetical protein